jgi:hypothetical protein
MKVRLFTLAAVAATTLSAQGVAQSDSLERALADLNSGLVAPANNDHVTWGGDFRLRNNWDDNGTATNNRDMDTRMRLTAAFAITEDSSAFAGFNGSEAWGDASGGFSEPGIDRENTETRVDRAYVTVNNLMGDGGTIKAGRDYYTFGSGRIIGSDEWDNNPSNASGVWYMHDMGGMNMHFAMLNQADGENGNDEGDDMTYVLSIDYSLDTGALGTINMSPYAIRNEADNSQNWKGATLSGSVMGFGYDAEYAQYDNGSGDTATAWAISTGIELGILASVPGISNGSVDISMSSSDDGFATLGATQWGVGGFSDFGGRNGGQEAWAGGTDITAIGMNFSPAEGWEGRIASHDVEDSHTSLDLSVSHAFNGNVAGWFGYAMVNPDAGEDAVTFWTTLEVSF